MTPEECASFFDGSTNPAERKAAAHLRRLAALERKLDKERDQHAATNACYLQTVEERAALERERDEARAAHARCFHDAVALQRENARLREVAERVVQDCDCFEGRVVTEELMPDGFLRRGEGPCPDYQDAREALEGGE